MVYSAYVISVLKYHLYLGANFKKFRVKYPFKKVIFKQS